MLTLKVDACFAHVRQSCLYTEAMAGVAQNPMTANFSRAVNHLCRVRLNCVSTVVKVLMVLRKESVAVFIGTYMLSYYVQ